MQNRSDVKSGVFLSSGIDSSKVLFHSGKHMEAININFEEYKKTKFDESLLAEKLTKVTGHKLLSKYYNKNEGLEMYENILKIWISLQWMDLIPSWLQNLLLKTNLK